MGAVNAVPWVQRRYFRPSRACRDLHLKFETDRYNGVMVDLAEVPHGISETDFDSLLTGRFPSFRI